LGNQEGGREIVAQYNNAQEQLKAANDARSKYPDEETWLSGKQKYIKEELIQKKWAKPFSRHWSQNYYWQGSEKFARIARECGWNVEDGLLALLDKKEAISARVKTEEGCGDIDTILFRTLERAKVDMPKTVRGAHKHPHQMRKLVARVIVDCVQNDKTAFDEVLPTLEVLHTSQFGLFNSDRLPQIFGKNISLAEGVDQAKQPPIKLLLGSASFGLNVLKNLAACVVHTINYAADRKFYGGGKFNLDKTGTLGALGPYMKEMRRYYAKTGRWSVQEDLLENFMATATQALTDYTADENMDIVAKEKDKAEKKFNKIRKERNKQFRRVRSMKDNAVNIVKDFKQMVAVNNLDSLGVSPYADKPEITFDSACDDLLGELQDQAKFLDEGWIAKTEKLSQAIYSVHNFNLFNTDQLVQEAPNILKPAKDAEEKFIEAKTNKENTLYLAEDLKRQKAKAKNENKKGLVERLDNAIKALDKKHALDSAKAGLKAKRKRLMEAELNALNNGTLAPGIPYEEQSRYDLILDLMATWNYWQDGFGRDRSVIRSHDEVKNEYAQNNADAFANHDPDIRYMWAYREQFKDHYYNHIYDKDMEKAYKATAHARAG
jgi:hypothetical protein